MLAVSLYAQFAYRLTDPIADRNFRIGVEAYHRGRYAEALMLFESVLAGNPGDQLSLYWLGKAYHKLGLSSITLDFWRESLQGSQVNSFVEARIELLALILRTGQGRLPERLIESRSIDSQDRRQPLFLRPSVIKTRPDGSMLVVANGSNEILRINANGLIIERYTGGVSGFDRPFGLDFLSDGQMVLSEFAPDRLAFLSPRGQINAYAPMLPPQNRLVGPQYLATDADNFIYVSDVGRSRIVKFAPDGSFITAFDGRSAGFQGLRMPTGLAVIGDLLYVADVALRSIHVFDLYGNYLAALISDGLIKPEGLTAIGQDLLIADTSRVLLYASADDSLRELYRSSDRTIRIVSAAFDANHDLILADYNNSRILILTDPVAVYSGLMVDVERVYADNFPAVSLDVRVSDNSGRPLVGLTAANFYIAEFVTRTEVADSEAAGIAVNRIIETVRPAAQLSLAGTLDATDTIDMVYIVGASPDLVDRRLEVRDAVASAHTALGQNSRQRLILAYATPQPAISGSIAALTAPLLAMRADRNWRLDLALRLAVNELSQSSARRAITLVTSGNLDEALLDEFSLAELASLLNNNRISLHIIQVGRSLLGQPLHYLLGASKGSLHTVDSPAGLDGLASAIRNLPTGVYRLSFNSAADPDFGRRYLAVRTEVYFRDRSGKDETGYFAPLR